MISQDPENQLIFQSLGKMWTLLLAPTACLCPVMPTVSEYKQCPPGPQEGSLTVPLCVPSGWNLSLVVGVHVQTTAPSIPPYISPSPHLVAHSFPSSKTALEHPPADISHPAHF